MQNPARPDRVEPIPLSDNAFTRNSRGKIDRSLLNILRALSPPYSDLVFSLYDPGEPREEPIQAFSLPAKYEGRWVGFYPVGRPGMWTPLDELGTQKLLFRLERLGFGRVAKSDLRGVAVYILRKTQGLD